MERKLGTHVHAGKVGPRRVLRVRDGRGERPEPVGGVVGEGGRVYEATSRFAIHEFFLFGF